MGMRASSIMPEQKYESNRIESSACIANNDTDKIRVASNWHRMANCEFDVNYSIVGISCWKRKGWFAAHCCDFVDADENRTAWDIRPWCSVAANNSGKLFVYKRNRGDWAMRPGSGVGRDLKWVKYRNRTFVFAVHSELCSTSANAKNVIPFDIWM